MKLVELDSLRHALVGMPGSSGLSTEQRKRLTIAVELVANPSIIFMDEPTSGLDARAAAIVMRTVRNTVDTGRTVVCTIHQPSIDIFEAFDEVSSIMSSVSLLFWYVMVHLFLSTSLSIHFCCPVTSYETWRTSYLWRKDWCTLTDIDRLFSGDDFRVYYYYY